MSRTPVQVRGERLQLLPAKALYWPVQRMLVIADLHLGKAMHFRKAGIAAPAAVERLDLERLEALLDAIRPRKLLLLGDLFHSTHNSAWKGFLDLRQHHARVEFVLITGNHDILDRRAYAEADMEEVPALEIGPFRFSHHPEDAADHYGLAGHVHPAVRLTGKGRQYLTLPCFHFGPCNGLLPSFGSFTGSHRIIPTKGDRLFAISGEHVIRCGSGK